MTTVLYILKGRDINEKRERALAPSGSFPQMVPTARTGSAQSQKPGAPFGSPTLLARALVLGLNSAVFPDALVLSCSRDGAMSAPKTVA